LQNGSPAKAILVGWLVAGTCDITAACVQYYALRGVGPATIFQSVASGLLGADAFTGGAPTAALGLGLHYFIAFVWTTVFVLASHRLGLLRRRPLVVGAAYGVFVFLVMHFVVLPLSAVAKRPINPAMALIQVGIHIVCIGWPIVLAARRFAWHPEVAEAQGRDHA
jgi:hypothetical protein